MWARQFIGLIAVALLVHLGEIHVLAVIVEVAGTLPELGLEYLRADDDVVAALEVFLSSRNPR